MASLPFFFDAQGTIADMNQIPTSLLLSVLALGIAPAWAQEAGGQSVKDKLRATLPP